MRSLRAFLISFVLSLVLFGFGAYYVLSGSWSFDFTPSQVGDSTIGPETDNRPTIPGETDSMAPSGADDKGGNDVVLPKGNVSNATYLYGIGYVGHRV